MNLYSNVKFRVFLVLVLMALAASACGSDQLDTKSDSNNAPANNGNNDDSLPDGDDVSQTIGEDDRVTDLTDSQIREICADVEPFSNVECVVGAETTQISSTTTSYDCERLLTGFREEISTSCLRAQSLAYCWQADPCERVFSSECALECPEQRDCYQQDVDACDPEWCYLATEQRLSDDGTCYETQPAFCLPKDRNCNNVVLNAIDPQGQCWLLSGDCGLPKGWSYDSGVERMCPYTDWPTCE